MTSDKELECNRYSRRAELFLAEHALGHANPVVSNIGASSVPIELRAPYICYERLLADFQASARFTLEVCAGTGLHSGALLSSGVGSVVCTDISEISLKALATLHADPNRRLSVLPADMESLPFGDETCDLVVCAGGLSYGDPEIVLNEIFRVLRPGGHFVSVDSYNENPVYRFNRWLHYLRGNRSKSTLLRMPNNKTIEAYRKKFGSVHVRYFGSIAWLTPLLKGLFGSSKAAALVERFDTWLRVRRSAFKFVMVAKKLSVGVEKIYEH